MYAVLTDIELHEDTVNCLGFSEDGFYLASGDDAGLLVISETQNPTSYDKYHFPDSITSLVWIPGSQCLFVGLANCDVNFVSLVSTSLYFSFI